jgi:hypothetical protein
MTLDEMKEQAKSEVLSSILTASDIKISKVYENLLDGTLISVSFRDSDKEEWAHVHFGKDQTRFYRYHSDILNAVSHYKEQQWFFRFLEFAGVGGLIAFTLIIVFSVLLCVVALSNTNANPTVIEVIKLSFTTILGFFFGSQATSKK